MISDARCAELTLLIADGKVDAFYNSRTWRNKRKRILQRDRYECQRCKRRGRYKRAECVHHIKEIREYPELALDDGNLEALCNQCHNEIHGKRLLAAENKSKPVTAERW